MIVKNPVSEMMFILQHNTVNVSKETPDTEMRLTSFEREENTRFLAIINHKA